MPVPRINAPSGFASRAEGRTLAELTAYYGVSHDLIVRWKREAGVLKGRGGSVARMAVPADFADNAHQPNAWLLAHYKVSGKVLNRWRKEAKAPAKYERKLRPVPDDFAQHANETSVELIARYRTTSSIIARWRRETGLFSKRCTPNRTEVPADLAQLAPTMSYAELAAHYGRNHKTIRRWLQEIGVKTRSVAPPRPRLVSTAKPLPPKVFVTPACNRSVPRDGSPEGQAADHLRCATRAIIHRCTETGRADIKGEFWRYGNVILTGDELIQRAQRHGWGRWAA